MSTAESSPGIRTYDDAARSATRARRRDGRVERADRRRRVRPDLLPLRGAADPRPPRSGVARTADLRVPRECPPRHGQHGDARTPRDHPRRDHAGRRPGRERRTERRAPGDAGDGARRVGRADPVPRAQRSGGDRGARADLREPGRHDALRSRRVGHRAPRWPSARGTASSIATTTRRASCSATSPALPPGSTDWADAAEALLELRRGDTAKLRTRRAEDRARRIDPGLHGEDGLARLLHRHRSRPVDGAARAAGRDVPPVPRTQDQHPHPLQRRPHHRRLDRHGRAARHRAIRGSTTATPCSTVS